MKIGIVSDSHGKCDRLIEAVGLLVGRGVEAVVHCGDLGDETCLWALGRAGVPAYAVGGNTDRNISRLIQVADQAGVTFHAEVIEVPLGQGRFLAATHGHDHELLNELLMGQQFPYLCVGHTHRCRDERIGPVRLINPGALHRAARHTIVTLDTDRDAVEFLEIPG